MDRAAALQEQIDELRAEVRELRRTMSDATVAVAGAFTGAASLFEPPQPCRRPAESPAEMS